jgi:SAM-dependent methyltransferase
MDEAERDENGIPVNGSPWYVSLFGQEHFDIYGGLLSDERTTREVEGIVKLLALPPGSHILDLACGHGRHAIPLAEQGYRVTGQDLSEVFLERARAEAQARGVMVRWVHRDMREIPLTDEFDAIINIFTAFGYFESDSADEKVLHQVHKALRPGGHFLLDSMHRDAVVRGFQPFDVSRRDTGLVVTEERHFDQLAGRTTVRVTLFHPDGRRTELRHVVLSYTPTELVVMLARAGLELQATYGGLDGTRMAQCRHSACQPLQKRKHDYRPAGYFLFTTLSEGETPW